MSPEAALMAFLGCMVLAFALGWWIAENKYRKQRGEAWELAYADGYDDASEGKDVRPNPYWDKPR